MFHETAEMSVPPHEARFSEETKAQLRRYYEENNRPTAKRRNEIAETLNSDPKAVSIWFQKEHAKEKYAEKKRAAKEKKDAEARRAAVKKRAAEEKRAADERSIERSSFISASNSKC